MIMNERYNKVALHGSPLVSGGDGMQPAGYSGRLSGEWCGSAAGLERAGYLRMANGHEVAFAIMNQNVLSGAKARAFQDAVCDEVIRER